MNFIIGHVWKSPSLTIQTKKTNPCKYSWNVFKLVTFHHHIFRYPFIGIQYIYISTSSFKHAHLTLENYRFHLYGFLQVEKYTILIDIHEFIPIRLCQQLLQSVNNLLLIPYTKQIYKLMATYKSGHEKQWYGILKLNGKT